MTQRFLPTALLLSLSLSAVACSEDGSGDGPEDTGKEEDKDNAATDLGKGDGSDVVAIGDSWMSLTGMSGIQFSLNAASGQSYRTYGIAGTCMMPGHCLLGGQIIPDQYAKAKAENPDIKTVVMTGGGNDILQDFSVLPSCNDNSFDTNPACKARIDEITTRLKELWAEMASDGVRDVVVVGYSRKANLLGPLSKSVVYSGETIQPICDAVPAPLRCHAIDSDMVVPDLALRGDNIHPDDPSYVKLGAAVFKLMEDKGMRR
jgi:hypothetical protein